jgi:hypothetical protein
MENPGNDSYVLKNAEEINANRLDYNVDNSRNANGGSSSSSLSSNAAKNKSADTFRYKYYHEQEDRAIIATKNVEINASEKFTSLANKTMLTVEDKLDDEGHVIPGEFVVKAVRKVGDPNGTELFMDVRGLTIKKKDGYDTDGETILNDYATTTALEVTNSQIQSEITRATAAEGTMSSRITQTESAITAEVTRASAAEGNLSSRITVTATEVSSKVSKNNIISEINQTAETITINASRINMGGIATTSDVASVDGRITNALNGTTTASKLSATILSVGTRIDVYGHSLSLIQKTIDGTTYHFLGYYG